MHLLLPPSEGKRAGGRGRAFGTRLGSEQGPLGDGRRAVAAALVELASGDPAQAAAALLLPPGVAADALATNAGVEASRTTRALDRYAGIVYDGLAADAMDDATRTLAGRRVLIFSGLLGVVRGDDPVPDYRVPAKATLPGIGVAGTYWRPLLDQVLPRIVGRGLIVDLRSGDYAAMWRPPVLQTIVVRVLSPAPRGGFAVISHTSKLSKGRLANELLRRAADGTPATNADDVAAAWFAAGGADVQRPTGNRLDLVTRTSTG